MTIVKRMRSFCREHMVAVTCMALVVLIVNYPLVLGAHSHVLGRSFEDVFEVLWQLSWLEKAIFEKHVNPLYTPDVYYPTGWYLASGAQPVWYLILLAPLTRILGSVLSYNIAQLLTLIMAGIGAYLLAYRLTYSKVAGLIAGTLYVLAPAVTIRQGGHLNILISIQWLPYTYLAFYQSIESTGVSRFRWAIAAGLLLALTILGHWYFLFIGTLPLLGLLLFMRRPSLRDMVAILMAIAVACSILLAPFAALSLYARRQMLPEESTFSLSAVDSGSLSPDRLFIPNPNHGIWGLQTREQFSLAGEQDIVALAYTALFLMSLALVLAHRRKTIPLLATAGIALLLAMGPSLHWQGTHILLDESTILAPISAALLPDIAVREGKVAIPLLGSILYRYLPFYDAMRVPARFTLPLTLIVSVLAGIGFKEISSHIGRKKGQALGLILLAAVIFEGWLTPYTALTDVSINARPMTVAWLKDRPHDAVLVEYPLSMSKIAMYSQAAHGHSIVNGYMSFAPPHFVRLFEAGNWPTQRSLELLRSWNVDYLVVNTPAGEILENNFVSSTVLEELCMVQAFDEGLAFYSKTTIFAISSEDACDL